MVHGTNRNADHYFHAVRKADSELLLRNLTDQIFELALISRKKMAAIVDPASGECKSIFDFVCRMV